MNELHKPASSGVDSSSPTSSGTAIEALPARQPPALRAARWLATGAVLLLLLWLGSYFAVPWVVKRELETLVSEKLGRKISVAAVEFKPWSLALTLHGLAIASQDGRTQQLNVKRIFVDAELESLWRLAPVVDAVSVDAPQLKLTHTGAGHYDIDDILTRLAQPAAPASDNPARFALYNLMVTDGAVDFVDTAVTPSAPRTHTLREFRVAVPFLSNLPSQRDVKVSPHLAFVLNGSRFDTAAEGTPFAQTRKTDAVLKVSGLDLKPYLPYLPQLLPAALPVKLQAAVLNLDLKIGFEQTPDTRVRLTGRADIEQLALSTPADKGLLTLGALKVELADVRPLERVVKLDAVTLQGLRLSLQREADGQLQWPKLSAASKASSASQVPVAPKSIARSEDRVNAAKGSDTQNAVTTTPPGGASNARPDARPRSGTADSANGWQVALQRLSLQDGAITWADASTQPQASLGVKGLAFEATSLAWPLTQAVPFQGAAGLEGNGASGQFSYSGTASLQAASVSATVANLPLTVASAYLAQWLEPTLEGTLNTDLALAWKAAQSGTGAENGASDSGDLAVNIKRLSLDHLALVHGAVAKTQSLAKERPAPTAQGRGAVQSQGNNPGRRRDESQTLASVQQLVLGSTTVQLAKRELNIGTLEVKNPKTRVERAEDKHWMFERWLKASAHSTTNAPVSTAAKASPANSPHPVPAERPWKLGIADLALQGAAFSFTDKAGPKPVALDISGLNLNLKQLALGNDKPSPLNLVAKIGAGQLEPGQLSMQGSLALQPFALQTHVDAKRLPIHALAPYAADMLRLELLRADTSYVGQLQFRQTPTGPVMKLGGDLSIEEFRANTEAPTTPTTVDPGGVAADSSPARSGLRLGNELLSWKALAVRGLDVAVTPDRPTRVDVRETVLSDFFARLIIRESGRINLQELIKTPAGESTATATVSAGAPAAPADPNAPIVHIGPVSLLNGKVYFSDRFVKPNYSADLTELTGKLGAFSSEGVPATAPSGTAVGAAAGSPTSLPAVQLADLELRGRAEGTASLEIVGKLNPLAKPLALDIQGKVRDLELPPLSTYAIKYAGHGIERGKLSVDVAYVVKPDGQLSATNKLVLNQLSFGDQVEGAKASLPVKLAVALLADRNGVIDLDLPISGSLNDPQFRIGPLIFKIILNVIGKALTSPFSLLAGAFGGGGDELSMVGFAPGSARLTPEAQQSLDKVAKALNDRPSLKMTVVGSASLEAERDAYQRERLAALMRAEKRRATVVSGGGDVRVGKDPLDDRATTVSDAEYPALLKEVYKRADIPKPRNVLGMAKDLPLADMESLLLANLPATPDAMRQLALQRGVAVKDYLVSRQLPSERLFLGAAKTVTPESKWSPRAELSLAMP